MLTFIIIIIMGVAEIVSTIRAAIRDQGGQRGWGGVHLIGPGDGRLGIDTR